MNGKQEKSYYQRIFEYLYGDFSDEDNATPMPEVFDERDLYEQVRKIREEFNSPFPMNLFPPDDYYIGGIICKRADELDCLELLYVLCCYNFYQTKKISDEYLLKFGTKADSLVAVSYILQCDSETLMNEFSEHYKTEYDFYCEDITDREELLIGVTLEMEKLASYFQDETNYDRDNICDIWNWRRFAYLAKRLVDGTIGKLREQGRKSYPNDTDVNAVREYIKTLDAYNDAVSMGLLTDDFVWKGTIRDLCNWLTDSKNKIIENHNGKYDWKRVDCVFTINNAPISKKQLRTNYNSQG